MAHAITSASGNVPAVFINDGMEMDNNSKHTVRVN